MDKERLRAVVVDQHHAFWKKEDFVFRDVALEPLLAAKEIIVISGVRRSGKSTLLRIIADRLAKVIPPENVFYLNFDDERLVDFTPQNFNDLLELFFETHTKGKAVFLLDEVQNVAFWEKWVNRLHEQEEIKVFVTGSNASLLSSEIATSLTGRNITIELFPFSFREFLRLQGEEAGELTTKRKGYLSHAFQEYLERGSFPQVIKSQNKEFLKSYFNDILYKDIIARYSLRDVKEIKELAVYLASHIGKPLSYHQLATMTGIKSVSTIKNYWEYFQQSFLFFKLSLFDYSIKRQLYNPAKNYCIDVQLANQIGFAFTEDRGRLLENISFIELKRRGEEVYYHKGKKECDFVIKRGRKITMVIQVCTELNQDSREREIAGLLDAAKTYNLKTGFILTGGEESAFQKDGVKITVLPLWKWLLQPAAI